MDYLCGSLTLLAIGWFIYSAILKPPAEREKWGDNYDRYIR